MAIDLSGLKVGTAWRVRTSIGDGTLIVFSLRGNPGYVVVYDIETRAMSECGYTPFQPSGLSKGGQHRIESILHELKAPGDITAADLDGRVIETLSGVGLFFADGDVLINSDGEWGAGGTTWPEWADGCTTEADIQAAYLADLERRRNPPVEIAWQGECRDDDGTLLSAWCEVRGEKWRVSRTGDNRWLLYRGRQWRHSCYSETDCMQYIRDHYASKDRATST